jgi:hypothetical protein
MTYTQLIEEWLEYEKKRGLVDFKVTIAKTLNRTFKLFGITPLLPDNIETVEDLSYAIVDALTSPSLPDPELL